MGAGTVQPKLGPRFEEALALAARLHRRQVRKGGDVPYVSHLLTVTALVLEDGGGEDLAVAALLHDAVEDQGGAPTLDLVRGRFGDHVAGLVDAVTESERWSSLPWLDRKRRQLERLEAAPPEALRIKAADTLHNVTTVMNDWERIGDRVWDRFDPDSCPVNQVWHWREVARIVARAAGGSLLPARLCAALRALRERTRPACARDHEHPGAPAPACEQA
jgi:(p)ppGpp synthase/HD superfamily hydrolase